MMNTNEQVVSRRMASVPLSDGGMLALHSFDWADWQHIKQQSLTHYQRQIIQVWQNNADMIEGMTREQATLEGLKEAQKITLDMLPRKQLVDSDTVIEVDYPTWWMSVDEAGMCYALWLSAKKCSGQQDLTIDDVGRMFLDPAEREIALNKVGELSHSELAKNSSSPDAGAENRRKRAARRARRKRLKNRRTGR